MKTPVALFIFNRPTLTAQVFEVIRAAQPPQLFVVADGPRPERPGEAEKCLAARAVIERVDWPCEVVTNYADTNMGLRARVSSGMDWLFEQVEEAITMEDDCLVHPSFFPFCEEMLERYRDDERVMAVSGYNFQFGRRRTEDSYYFSRYPHCVGWATWRRAWRLYDDEMSRWPAIREGDWLRDVLDSPGAVRYWRRIFDATYTNQINSWAYRWTLSCWLNSGLTILPNVNLISNIGFTAEGTNTTDTSVFGNMAVEPMTFPLRHPHWMIRNAQADTYTQRTLFINPSLSVRARGKAKQLLRRVGFDY